ncbi:4Fe-4S ferredoxin iron-sulfur binding domain protein [Methanococcus vannielii SB]|uniref:4Fe-4S ferredoxin iron-sulfur binding domain protein n=2 Tax=Methanococcus vannielii TaxID=2187 RepID=A6UPV5_METVS|nr:4Fe-4S ferredoxin iron-sulfur binding domain protein [Methanococcus vannielii SB]
MYNIVVTMKILECCVGCGTCVPFCPNGAITSIGNAEIECEKCTKCGLCVSYCPLNAIKN